MEQRLSKSESIGSLGVLTVFVVQLEQRVAVVEANTSIDNRDPLGQIEQSLEDTHGTYEISNADQILSNGSNLCDSAISGPSIAGMRSLTPPSLEGAHSRQTLNIMPTENFLRKSDLARSCELWFEEYHTWFPLLHQQTLIRCLEGYTNILDTGRPLVLQAITVAALGSTRRSHDDSDVLKDDLKNATVLAALNASSLDSIQALLVLSMLQYGNSHLAEAGNLLAVCRK